MRIKSIKNRKEERIEDKIVKKKLSKECDKKVAYRLQKKLIDRGKTPNLGANFFALSNI